MFRLTVKILGSRPMLSTQGRSTVKFLYRGNTCLFIWPRFSRSNPKDLCFFMPPRSKTGGILFLSCPYFCNSVILFSSLKLQSITFEQRVLELSYFTWVFLVIRPLFFPCDLDLRVWPIFWKKTTLTLLMTLEQWVLELRYFTLVFFVIRPFRGYHHFDTVTLTLEFEPFFGKL